MTLLDYWSNVAECSPSSSRENVAPATAEDFFHAYIPRVYSVARRMLGNDADAEDVTQDVLLQVVRKLNTFRGEARITTWLHRVTVNAALLHRRKQTRHLGRQVNTPLDILGEVKMACAASPGKPPDQQVLDNETRQLIEDAIAHLPDIYRDVYVLADIEGLSNAQISNLLNLRVPAVKSRLHRARLMMREILVTHFY